ncbi:MAG: hypothetical protein ABIX46_00455 [Burkholderiaceae bacterium]
MSLLLTLALRFAGCSAVAWLAWRWLGAAGLVYSGALFGLALARPLVEAAGAWWRTTRRWAYGDLDGRHYAHRGTPIDVVEDTDHVRWLRTDDVRRVIGGLPGDPALARLYPDGVRRDPPRRAALATGSARISAEALADYLRKSTAPASLRFARWLERDVAHAARRLRERAPKTSRP